MPSASLVDPRHVREKLRELDLGAADEMARGNLTLLAEL
jgi:hypothetical protein